MVKLRCTLACCWTRYEASPTEMWVCPACEEYGLAEIEEINQEEIELMWGNLQTAEFGNEKLKIPKKTQKFVEGKSKIYYGIVEGTFNEKVLFNANISEHYEVLKTLTLLYDVIIVSDVWWDYFHYYPNEFRNFIEAGHIIPFSHKGGWWDLRSLEEETRMAKGTYYIGPIANSFVSDNLISAMTFEDFKEIKELPQQRINKLLNDTKLRRDEKFLAAGKLELILNTLNRHNLCASILDAPMYVDTDSIRVRLRTLSKFINPYIIQVL